MKLGITIRKEIKLREKSLYSVEIVENLCYLKTTQYFQHKKGKRKDVLNSVVYLMTEEQ